MDFNTHNKDKTSLFKRGYTRFGFIVFMLLTFPLFVFSQLHVPVCQDGVVRVASFLVDADYVVDAAPPGHLQKGYWIETAGLTFSNINDPNAIISGFDGVAEGTTYTITWYHGLDQTYTLTLEVTGNVAPEYELLNEDGNTDNVLFCSTPNKYEFTVAPSSTNPGAAINEVDYLINHAAGITTEETGASNPESFNLNSSIDYADLDIFRALVSDGTCLDITTNTIQLAEITSVIIEIQGDLSSCDPTVFDGNHVLEVFPYDPNHFDYQWYHDGNPIVGATDATYTLSSSPGEGDYTVEVVEKTGACGPFTSDAVAVSIDALPDVSINDNPTGSGIFEICDGTLSETLTTSLVGGTMPTNYDYDWYQNGTIVTGNNSTYNLNNDDGSAGYNAYGDYYVVFKDADNEECKSISDPVTVQTIRLDYVALVKANNAQPFCITGTPLINITVTGGLAPYTINLDDGTNSYTRTLNSNGGAISMPAITSPTTYTVTSVVENATGCTWTGTGAETVTFNVYTSPTVLTTTGNDACVPSSSVSLSIDSPEDGITYQLKRDNNGDGTYDTDIGAAITYNTGDPVPLTWSGYTTAGTYKIFASTATCSDVPMDNEFVATSVPVDKALQASGVAPRCSDPADPVTFSISTSEEGVDYSLYRDYSSAGETLIETLTGDAAASDLFFTPQYLEGTYTVIARNGACSLQMTNTYTIVSSPDVTGITLSATSYCESDATTITLSDTQTGVTYTLYYDDGSGAVATGNAVLGSTGNARNIVTNTVLAAGEYTVKATITGGTCYDWIADQIDIISPPSDIAFVTDGYICNSGSLVLALPGENGVTYTLYKDGVVDAGYVSRTGNGTNTIQFNGLTEGVYTISASNGTCTMWLSDELTVEASPLSQNVTVLDNDYCSNESPVTITVDATEPDVEYQLILSSTSAVVATISGLSTRGAIDFNGVTAGTYEIHATNNSCDIVIQTGIVITEHNVATINGNIPSDICSDVGTQVFTGSPLVVSGSSTGLYEIIGGAGFDPGRVADPDAGTLTFDPANCAFETTYSLSYTYTDGNGCKVVEYGSVTVHDLNSGSLAINSSVPANPCQTDNFDYPLYGTLNGNPVAGTFSSSSSGLKNVDPVNGTAKFNPFDAGNGTHVAYFNYTDVTGCAGQASITFTIGTPLSIIGLGPQYCSNDNTTYTLNGSPAGGTFEVLDPSSNSIATGIANGTSWLNPNNLFLSKGTGTYSLIYTYNDGGCINTLSATFDIVESLDATFKFPNNASGIEQTVFCDDDAAVTFIPVGALGSATDYYTGAGVAGNTFVPSSGSVNYSPTPNVITHTVDNNGCITTATRDAYVTQVNVGISGLDATYCTNSGVKTILANGTDAAFGEATFSATINGNATAFLTDGGAGDNTATINPSIGPGVYEVTMYFEKTGDGCEKTIAQSVTVYDEIPVSFGGVSEGQNICSSSSDITLTGTMPDGGKGNFELLGGAVGLTDAVTDDGLAVVSPISMTAGAYTIRYNYESADGCLSYFDININIVDAPSSMYSVTGGGAYCIGDPGITVGLGGSNTGVNYELLLNGISIGAGVTHVGNGSAIDFGVQSTEGTYTVIAEYSGCTATMTGSVTIDQYELVLQEVSHTDITCNGSSNGSVTLTTTGGSGTYEYSDNGGLSWKASPIFTGLSSGNHTFSVRDMSSAACESLNALTINIAEPADALSVSLVSKENVGCVPCTMGVTCEGEATILITGGTPYGGADLTAYPSGYKITWPAAVGVGQISADNLTAVNLINDDYSILIEDANGCSTSFDVTIGENADLNLTELNPATNHVDNFCKDGSDGEFIVQAAGGSGEYQFSMDGGINFLNSNRVNADEYKFENLEAGDYTIIVRDKNNPRCQYTIATDITITEPATGLSLTEVTNTPTSCFGKVDGSFTVRASGGNGTYEFSSVNPTDAGFVGWTDNGTNEFTVGGLQAGKHSVWVRDEEPGANNCSYGSLVVTVSQPDQLAMEDPVVTDVSCNSGNDGTVTLTGLGGSGNHVYSKDGGANWQSSNVFSGLDVANGPYLFSIAESTDATCQSIDIRTVYLNEPAAFSISEVVASHKDVSCFGGNDGEFEVSVTGGVGPFEYRIYNGTNYITTWSNVNTFSGYVQGAYEVCVRDMGTASADFCEKDRILPITISQPAAALSIDAESVTDVTCNSASDGEIEITISGGSAPYNYQWKNVATNINVSDLDNGKTNHPVNLTAGDYQVDIADDKGCTVSKTYTVDQPAVLSLLTDNIVDVTCNGNNTGEIRVEASGGLGTYSFNVDNSGWTATQTSTLYTASNLPAGDHTIWVKDPASAVACEYKSMSVVSVNQPDVLDLKVTNHTDVSCFNGNDGAIVVTAKGGSGNYDYYIDGIGWQSGTGTTHTFTSLTAGVYNLSVRDKNDNICEFSTSFEISQPLDFSTTCVATDVKCYGESTGVLTLTTTYSNGDAGAFVYSIDGGSTWVSSPVSNLAAGTYVVDVKDNSTGCVKTNQILVVDATISQPTTGIAIGSEAISNVTCFDGMDGEIDLQGNVSGGTVVPAGNYTYTWYKKGTPDVIVAQGDGLDDVTGLKEGIYYVEVEDDNGCTATSTDYSVTQPTDWIVGYTKSDLTEYNAADGVINVNNCTGSNGGYSIAWQDKDGNSIPAYNNIWNVTTFDAGTYKFVITDTKGCTYPTVDSINITLSEPFDFNVTDPNTSKTDVSCFGSDDGVIKVEIVSGNGDYTLVVDGTLEKGAPNYGNTINQTANNFVLNDLEAGSYYLELTDNVTKELYTATVKISQPAELTIAETKTDITCNGNNDGAISVVLGGVIAGAEISWTSNNGFADGPLDATDVANLSQSGLKPGDYTVVVNNNNGCPAVQLTPVTISEPDPWNVTSSVINVSSFGHNDGAVTVDFPPTGNTGPYTIAWSDDPTIAWSRSGLVAGDYTYTITDATTLCTYSETLAVSQPDQLLFDVTPTNATCYGYSNGNIGVNISSGNPNYQIELSGVEFDGTTFTTVTINNNTTGGYVFSGLKAGNYTISIIDSKGENLSKSVTLTHLSKFSVNLVSSNNITCNSGSDGSIEIDIAGRAIDEATSTINWTRTNPVGWSVTGKVDDGTTDLKEQTGLEAGSYTINVSDQFGCDATAHTEVLTEPSAITSTNTVTHVSTNGGNDGNITIDNVENTVGSYSVEWYKDGVLQPGVTGNVYDNLEAGEYIYIITDANGCTGGDTLNVTEPGMLTVTFDSKNINCFGDDNGIISATITSGNAPYNTVLTGIPDDGSGFASVNSALTNPVFSGLKPGKYTITTTDNAGQSEYQDITIVQNPENTLTETLKNITCEGYGDGSITISIKGPVDGSETWQVIDPNGATVSTTTIAAGATAKIAGDYQVIVTNKDGCLITETYPITEPDAWNVHHNVVNVSPTGNTNGEINIDVLSGNTPDATKSEDYTITWTGPVGAPIVNDQRLQTGLPTGTYTYHIEDAVGCSYDSGDIIISEPDMLTANVTESDVDILCYGDDKGKILVTLLSGNEPYSVHLTGNQYDGNGFDETKTIATNTGSYLWDNLLAGEYQVEITDAVGNVFTQTAIVLSQPNENVITEDVTHLTCNGADKGSGEVSIQLNRNFLATDNVTWTGPMGIIDNGALSTSSDLDKVTVSEGGNYTYTFTDSNGCPLSGTIVVNEPDPFSLDWSPTDATVYGTNDGIIDVHTIAGNNGVPYTINWSDDATIHDFIRNDLVAGTYEFTIEDAYGCDTTISNVVIGQPNPLIVVVTPKDAVCYGDTNGEIQVEIQSHNGGYYYQITGKEDDGGTYDSGTITPSSVNSVVKNLKAGTYTIDVYDSKGTHYHKENIRIEQEVKVSLIGTPQNISCNGVGDGSVLVALDGRAAVASDNIVWSGSKGTYLTGDLMNNAELKPVASPESFNVVVTSVEGCTYSGTFAVTEPNEIVISVDDIQDVTCAGGTDGSVDISVTGRSGGGYTYVWEKKNASGVYQSYPGSTASLSALSAGEYQVIVSSITDNCEATYSDIEVLDGSEITINESLTDITSCVGDNSGVISVSVEDGIPPYTVSVTGQDAKTADGSSAFVFDNLYAGDYVIEVSDARGIGCSSVTKNVSLTEPGLALDVSNLTYNIDCDPQNANSGTFSFDVTGGVSSGGNYNYQILLPEASIAKTATTSVGSTHKEVVTSLKAGTYNLTVLDLNSSDPAACAFTYQFTLEHIEISNDPVVNTTCKGVNNGAITGITVEGASANYTYSWSTTDAGLGLDNTTLNQSGLSVGTYVLTITDPDRGGCSVSKEFYVDVDHTIDMTSTVKDVTCNAGSDGAISIEVSGVSSATTYTWTGPGIVNANLEDQQNLTAGNYTLEISSDFSGQTCIADASFTVDQPDAISYDAKYNYTDCDPFVRTLVIENQTGGSGVYSYQWDGPSFTPKIPADPTKVPIYEGGVYSISVKDNNQCKLTKTLSVPDEIGINPVVNDVTCNGGNNGSIVLNVSGGSGLYNFSWTGPSGYSSANRNIDNLYTGEYTVVITDQYENDGGGNCSREFTLEVEEPEPIVISSTVERTSCYGAADGKIEIEVSGGNAPYSYNWTPVVGANLASNKDQYNLPADVYSVTVTDASSKGGCVATKNIEVLQDDKIELSTVVTDTQCDGTGGKIDLTATGGSGSGFAYNWSSADGTGLAQGVPDQSGLSGGTYTVVVSDLGVGRSCTATASETLTHNIEIVNDEVTPVSCSGNDDGSISYDVIGGDGNYTYSWTVIAGDPTQIVPGAQNQSGLSEGEYKVTITDGRTVGATDCAITHSFIVVASTGLSVNVSVEDSKMCFGEPGGKLTASVTGGSGDYSYYWNGVKGSAVHSDLVQGIYGLRVVDNVLGCSYIQSYEIEGPDAPLTIDNIDVSDVLCYNENTGAIKVSVSGGTLPSTGDYIYTWTGGTSSAVGTNPTKLFAGTYNLTVTDANGCTVESGDIIVNQPISHIKVDNPQITDVSVSGGSDGQVMVDVYDGVAPRSVAWYDASNYEISTLNPATGLIAGTYRVVATDDNGCYDELSGIRVVEPGEALGFEKTVYPVSPCSGENNGEIHINRVYGGYPIGGDRYRIQITGPATNVDTEGTEYDLTGLAPGTYRVIVSDNVPVSYQEDIVISEYPSLSLNTTKLNDVSCYGSSDGVIQVLVSGGKADVNDHYLVEITSSEGYYAYKDDAVAGTAFQFSGLPAGNYTVRLIDHAEDFDAKVPDRGNCELTEFTLITQPAAEVEISAVGGENEICKGESVDLSISTSNWDFAVQGNLRISVYDNFSTYEYVADKTPYVITQTPSSSRTYKVTGVVDPSNATCKQGGSIGSPVQVTVNDLPSANITGPDEVCEDGSVTLSVTFTGSKPFTFTWQDELNGTSDTETVDAYSYSFTDSPVADARYTILSVSDANACSASGNGSVDVSINDKPSVVLSGGTDICIGENANLNVRLEEGIAPFIITYIANGVEGTVVINSNPVSDYTWTVNPQVTTEYQITSVVDGLGCNMDISSSLTATVTVNQLPKDIETILSMTEEAVCPGTTNVGFYVDEVDGATAYLWTVDDGMSIITGNGTSNILVDFDKFFTGGYITAYAENDCGESRVVERWVEASVLPDAIITAPSGTTDICEGSTGLVYSIPVSSNASSYEWSVPAGLIPVGDVTGTSIVVDVDPNVDSTTGEVKVRPVNACGSDEPWSPGLNITITPLPYAYAGPDERICGTTCQLAAGPLKSGESGVWAILKGSGQYVNVAADQVDPKADIYNLSQGENIFVWTLTNGSTGCYTTDTVVIYNDMVSVSASAENYTVCDGIGQLYGTPLSNVDNADEGYWSTTGSSFIVDNNDENTMVQAMDAGNNTFTWTIRKGACYSSASVVMENDKPTDAVVYNSVGTIIDELDLPCGDNFTTIKGSTPTAGETGYWRIESGNVTIDNVNSPAITIKDITPGDHVLSWNILNGSCSSKTTVIIRNNYFTVDAGIDETTCDGTANLYGSEFTDGAVGEWTIVEGSGSIEDAHSPATNVFNLSQSNGGRNVFRWTVRRNGCASYDDVVIYNYQTSEAELEGNVTNARICDYEYTMNAVNPTYGSGIWTVVSGSGSFSDPQAYNTKVSHIPSGKNVYRWTVYNETCSSSVDFTLTNLHVDAYAGADTAVCGKTAQLNATPVPAGSTGSWSIASDGSSVVFNPSSSNPKAVATSLGYGVNTLIWTVDQDGCTTADTVKVSNNMPYEVDASDFIYTEANSTTLRADVPSVGTGLWSLLEGRGSISNPTSPTTQVTNLLPNYNYFRWTVTHMGCSDYIDVTVQSGVLTDADAGSDQLDLCQDYTTLSANEPEGTYGEWTIVRGSADFTAYNDPEAEITNISSGRNVFKWTLRFAGGSEESKSDTVVVVNNTPSMADAGYDITVCGNATVMNARSPLIGEPYWGVLSGGGVFQDENDSQTSVSGLASGENIFKYQIQNGSCFTYDTIRVFNYEPSDAYAGEGQIVCQDSAALNPELPTFGEGSWKVIEGSGKGKDVKGNETNEITGSYVYELAPGVNKFVWEVRVPGAASSCVKRDTVTIINNEPSISFAGNDKSVCSDSVTLSGSVPVYGTGSWTLVSGSGKIEDANLRNTKVNGLALGENRFRWTIDNNGCTSYDDVVISDNLIEAVGGYDQVNCADTAVLEGNNPIPGEGTWGIVGGSGSANFENNESSYTKVYNLDKGENILTWTINYEGCQSVSRVVVTNNMPSDADAGDNKATCDTYFVLGAATPEVGEGSWTIRSGGGDFVDNTNPSTRVDSMKFGANIYRWTVEHEGCMTYDDVEITYNTIQAKVGDTQEICADNTYLDANNASPGTGTWTVVGGSSSAKFEDVNDPVTRVYDLAKGNNRLRWTINNEGCTNYAEVTVVNNLPSTAYAGNTQELCTSETTLDATAVSVGTGSWEVLTGAALIADGEVNNPKAPVTGLSKGENVLRWTVTSDNGLCTSVDEVVVINNEPSEPYAGSSAEYCYPTVVLKAAEPDYGTGLWSIIEGGGNFDDPTLPNATISNLQIGDNVLRWTVKKGQCSLYSDITITNNTPSIAKAGPDIEDCKDYAYLDANTPEEGSGFWTLISGNATFTDVSDPKTYVYGLTFGENILMWNIQKGGCVSTDQVTVFNRVPDQAAAGSDRSTCDDYITLNANEPESGEGKWVVISGLGEFDDEHDPYTIVRDLGLGENQFKWVVSFGECSNEDAVVITSNKANPYAGEDDVTYESSYQLKASNPGDLGATWSLIAGTGSFNDNTFFNTTVDNLSEGVNTFRWSMNVNGCVTHDDVSITYRIVPNAGFVCDTTNGCYPLTVEFTNYSEGANEFTWDFGDGSTSVDRHPVHTFEDPATYSVVLTVSGADGMDGVYQKDITVYDHPVADFNYTPDVLYIPDDKLTCYSLSTDATAFEWDFGDGTTSTDVNPTHEYIQEGVYDLTLTVESEYGCMDEITKEDAITVNLQGFLRFPNTFMPRPDGVTSSSVGGGQTNTIFRPIYEDVADYKLEIFNRWGQLIYESTDIDEGWNGFYNGTLSPQAVYVWKATGTYISGKAYNLTGSVLLVR